ncbi:hypothetical protein [Coraliomargarita parva]|uniref:hypothetical protein n=1 Tax=Coraliomargarita parva TaxID=3014050 RepID=UPI0022B497C3|nr:hypothetical protein [Coraliomargarita parva]
MNKWMKALGGMVAVLHISAFAGSYAYGTEVISDTFEITGARVAGSLLGGSTAELGGVTWTASASCILGTDGTDDYVTSNTNTNVAGYVPFSFGAYDGYGDVATISLDVSPIGASGTWTALVFGRNGVSPTTNGVAWLSISKNTGTWSLMTYTTTLETGNLTDVASYSATGFNDYTLSYDQSNRTIVGVTINGVDVLSQDYVLSTTSDVVAAGFFKQYSGSTDQTKFNSFGVSVIPELSTVSLLIGGVSLVMTGLLRRRSRG